MTTERQIAYLELRGWTRDGGVTYWRRVDGINVMHWRMALDRQTEIDEQELIDAYLRLPVAERELEDCVAQLEQAAVKHLWNLSRIATLEAKLARIAVLVGRVNGQKRIYPTAWQELLAELAAPEVTHG